jgi:transcriptional regulator with PAS, ATPase and Fis domain
MEKLTGKKMDEIAGTTCLPEFVIDETTGSSKQLIKLVSQNGKTIEVNQSVKIVHDKAGVFHGGIGVLTIRSESVQCKLLTKSAGAAKQNFHGLLSRSPAMQDVFQIIQNAAETEARLFLGQYRLGIDAE